MQERLTGGSPWLDSLLYEEAWVRTNRWLDDDCLLVRVSDLNPEPWTRNLLAAEQSRAPWYRWRRRRNA